MLFTITYRPTVPIKERPSTLLLLTTTYLNGRLGYRLLTGDRHLPRDSSHDRGRSGAYVYLTSTRTTIAYLLVTSGPPHITHREN